MLKPKPGDYSHYYEGYINLVEEDVLNALEKQLHSSIETFTNIPDEKAEYSYAEGKWTIKEVLGHMNDSERIMAYRALAIARGEKQSIPGFEQDEYVAEGKFNRRTLADLIEEYTTLRKSNLVLFKSFDEETLNRKGIANENEISVLALIFIIAGHEKHHINVLKEKYGV